MVFEDEEGNRMSVKFSVAGEKTKMSYLEKLSRLVYWGLLLWLCWVNIMLIAGLMAGIAGYPHLPFSTEKTGLYLMTILVALPVIYWFLWSTGETEIFKSSAQRKSDGKGSQHE